MGDIKDKVMRNLNYMVTHLGNIEHAMLLSIENGLISINDRDQIISQTTGNSRATEFIFTLIRQDLNEHWETLKEILIKTLNGHIVTKIENYGKESTPSYSKTNENKNINGDDCSKFVRDIQLEAITLISNEANETFNMDHLVLFGRQLRVGIEEILETMQINEERPSETAILLLDDVLQTFITNCKEKVFENKISALKILEKYEDEMGVHFLCMSPDLSYDLLVNYHKNAKANAKEDIEKYFNAKSEKLVEKLDKMFECTFLKFQNKYRKNKSTVPAIGIDIGCTSCRVAYYNAKLSIVDVIHDNEKYETPCFVYFPFAGNVVVGSEAKTHAHIYPENTIFDFVRLIGRKFEDPTLANDIRSWPFKVVADEHGFAQYQIGNSFYSPKEVFTKFLLKIKQMAETYLKTSVSKSVITVPIYFNYDQKKIVEAAAIDAGLEILDIISEPFAAAISYNYHESTSERLVLVFNVASKSIDVTIFECFNGKIDVKGKSCDCNIGGFSFTESMVNFCVKQFETEKCIHLLRECSKDNIYAAADYNLRMRRLTNECEKQKIKLCSADEVLLSLDSLFGDLSLEQRLTKNNLIELSKTLVEQLMGHVDIALRDAGLNKSQIGDVIVNGKSSAMPTIKQQLASYFNGKPVFDALMDDSIVRGAAIRAAILNGCSNSDLENMDTFSSTSYLYLN